jgi:hypothetical protein
MISLQELDSLPFSEASPEALAKRPKPRSKFVSYPDWKLCRRHGLWFCFQCPRCSGSMIECSGL